MRIVHQRYGLILFVLLLTGLPAIVAGQETNDLVMTASGDGSLKVGEEEFKINAVVVKLLADGKAEINVISEINIFVSGTWSRGSEPQTIKLEIAGQGSSIEANGKLQLRGDGKSIDRLSLQGAIKTRKRSVEINFQAK